MAARAKVTPTVVSQVLSGGGSTTTRVSVETAERVRRLAREMGYRPNVLAQRLKGRPSDLVGVLIGADTTPVNLRRLAAVERAAHERGWRLMIGQFHGDVKDTREYFEDFLARGIDILLCFHNPPPVYNPPLLKLLERFRAIVFQTHSPHSGASVVDVDRAHGVRLAFEHLISRGRRRIALVLNDQPANDPLMADRLRGWNESFAALGEPVPEELCWCGTGAFPPPPELVAEAVQHLLDVKADAIIASNDVWALNLIRGLRRSGRSVPRDLSVIGFDNLEAAELCDPSLTTIHQSNRAFAEAAIGLLAAALEDASVTGRRVVVKPELIVRESS